MNFNPVVPRRISARKSLGKVLADYSSSGLLVSYREHGPTGVLPPHEHTDPYICVVLDGGYTESAAATIECVRGSLVAHPAGHAHENRFGAADTRCVNLYADPAWMDSRSFRRLLDDYRHIRLDSRNAAMCRLEQELVCGDDAATVGVASAVLELITLAIREESRRDSPGWIGRVIESIEANLSVTPTLGSLGLIAGVHPSHLARAFRRTTGETVGAYVRRRRLEQADQALAAAGASIAQVALKAGFCDQAHFTRAYRRQFGRTPGQRRRGA